MMKGQDDTSSNISHNTAFSTIFSQALSRRQVLQGGLVAAGMALLGGPMGSFLGRHAP
jgi:TAT (twin-arginine translocation) pathway-exported protein